MNTKFYNSAGTKLKKREERVSRGIREQNYERKCVFRDGKDEKKKQNYEIKTKAKRFR